MLTGLVWERVYTTRGVICFKEALAGSHNRGGGLERVPVNAGTRKGTRNGLERIIKQEFFCYPVP